MAHLVVVPIKLQVAVPARPCLRRRANLLLEAREPERFLVESVFWVVVQGRDARLEKVGVGPDRRRVRVADPPDGADREDRVERRILVAMCIFGYVRNWSMTLMGSIPSEQKTHADLRPSEVLLGDCPGEEKCHRVSGVEDGGVLFAHAVKMAGQTYSKRAVRPANYRPRCRSYLCPVNQLENRVSPVTLLSRGRDQTLPRVEYTVERIRTGSRRMHVGVPPPRLLKLVRTSERILLMWFDLVSLRGVLWWCNGRHARGTGEISAARGVEGDQNTDCSWRRRLKRKEKRGPPRPARRTH